MSRSVAAKTTAAHFRSKNRGGGLFSEQINQRVGSWLALAADRLGLLPTALTLANLVLAVGASVSLIIFPHSWWLGLLVLVAWQLAYSLDCADGQLARVTGQSSPAGARVDILSDVAVQISVVSAVSAVAWAHSEPRPAAWFTALFAGTWMINLVTSVLAQGATASSLVASQSPLIRVVKLIRDYGALIFLIGLVLAFTPAAAVWIMVLFAATNGLFLLASIAQSARASLRSA